MQTLFICPPVTLTGVIPWYRNFGQSDVIGMGQNRGTQSTRYAQDGPISEAQILGLLLYSQ